MKHQIKLVNESEEEIIECPCQTLAHVVNILQEEDLAITENVGSVLEASNNGSIVHPISYDGKCSSPLARQIEEWFEVRTEFFATSDRTFPGLAYFPQEPQKE